MVKTGEKRRAGIFLILALLCALAAYLALRAPQRSYSNADFGIETYKSPADADGDGTDDQTDLLESARAYVATAPKYRSAYYDGGWPDDGCGVCTDVVACAMRGAGYDLRALVDADIRSDPDAYGISAPDSNIDYRRVRNLAVYFARHAEKLTDDVSDIAEWQGGDIVVFAGHIAVVSDLRNRKGAAYIIHHANPAQTRYEEDALVRCGKVEGHYRIG